MKCSGSCQNRSDENLYLVLKILIVIINIFQRFTSNYLKMEISNVNLLDIGSKAQSKLELYRLLVVEGRMYLPPENQCSMDFISEICLQERKVLIILLSLSFEFCVGALCRRNTGLNSSSRRWPEVSWLDSVYCRKLPRRKMLAKELHRDDSKSCMARKYQYEYSNDLWA